MFSIFVLILVYFDFLFAFMLASVLVVASFIFPLLTSPFYYAFLKVIGFSGNYLFLFFFFFIIDIASDFLLFFKYSKIKIENFIPD